MPEEETTRIIQKRTREQVLEKAREIRKLQGNLGGSKPGNIKNKTLLKLEIREEFKAKFEKVFGKITDKMLDLAEGIQVCIARDWEYKDGQRHRTGRWKQITNPDEIIELLNGTDDGEEDSYHMIYTKDPNTDMIKYISDQLMGKAPQKLNVDHSSTQLTDVLKEIRANNKDIVASRTNENIIDA